MFKIYKWYIFQKLGLLFTFKFKEFSILTIYKPTYTDIMGKNRRYCNYILILDKKGLTNRYK